MHLTHCGIHIKYKRCAQSPQKTMRGTQCPRDTGYRSAPLDSVGVSSFLPNSFSNTSQRRVSGYLIEIPVEVAYSYLWLHFCRPYCQHPPPRRGRVTLDSIGACCKRKRGLYQQLFCKRTLQVQRLFANAFLLETVHQRMPRTLAKGGHGRDKCTRKTASFSKRAVGLAKSANMFRKERGRKCTVIVSPAPGAPTTYCSTPE